MQAHTPSPVPGTRKVADLGQARRLALGCTACDLFEHATQTVFGEGSDRAALMLVGEQPGDREDLAGHPFVGPAGTVLDRALAEAGIDRERIFITNVVKHFKWRPSGKRRLHDRPNQHEIRACRPWLDLELDLVKPRLVVALGATAGQLLVGPTFRLSEQRSRLIDVERLRVPVMATYHPSAVLRARTPETRAAIREGLTSDLRAADAFTHQPSSRARSPQ